MVLEGRKTPVQSKKKDSASNQESATPNEVVSQPENEKAEPEAVVEGDTDEQASEGITVTVTNEIVGYTTVKSYHYRSSDQDGVILYEVPLYRVTLTAKDEDGVLTTKDYQAVRFGVQKNSKGGPFMTGITEGAFNLSPSNYAKGSYHIDGGMPNDGAYIHAGNANISSSSASYIGCVGISGPGEWTSFKNDMATFGFGNVPARVIFQPAAIPALVDSKKRYNP